MARIIMRNKKRYVVEGTSKDKKFLMVRLISGNTVSNIIKKIRN